MTRIREEEEYNAKWTVITAVKRQAVKPRKETLQMVPSLLTTPKSPDITAKRLQCHIHVYFVKLSAGLFLSFIYGVAHAAFTCQR